MILHNDVIYISEFKGVCIGTSRQVHKNDARRCVASRVREMASPARQHLTQRNGTQG